MADKEKLSALMDGELVDKALITEIEQDGLATWNHFHLIGDVMRGEAPERLEWNIAQNVALALEDEPVHSTFTVDNIVDISEQPLESQPVPSRARRHLPVWLTQFGQVAVAACVSLAVILGVQQYGGSESGQPATDQLPVLQTIPFSGSAAPVSLTRSSVEQASPASEANLQGQRRHINALLQDYELQLRLSSNSTDKLETVAE
ncbi:RseA family anti-sigma factor [Vibrio ostreicida]|uniref:Anti-sigma-E factor RseA n=1 Tax=Vibrio ostreicida TaxID=526588 RepID=A0ABT8BVY9_9VIBR|nr:RseA family anti-sigma factor [Vibrio ostreicida]MDN3608188.1 RseA family anti-sigma factor [Vibrio ostreicida]MDN3610962.1 RseA family anti-sigma factor [Vibrio ostreicida]MDN3611004.1 RseA family anti-sigma factor [Vibrio ostreicida]NPD10541.1 anti-sigma E factor [Vibrio ostreicida]